MKIRIGTSITSIFILIFVFHHVFTVIAQDRIEDMVSVDSTDIKSQMYELETSLYCFCGCERMTFEVCQCGTATHVKKGFRDALTKGETVEDIRAAYLKKHGPRYSALMPAKGINLIAYLMPAVILIVVGGVVYIVLQRFRREESSLTQSDEQVSDELQQQVEAELEKYKEQN